MASKEKEIVVSRVLDAPRDLVFDAFTQQEHAEKWWVPNGETHEWNATPGGHWRYSMPVRGTSYAFKVTFIEIDKPNRLVYDYGNDAEGADEPVRTHVTFEEEAGKTKVTLQLVFASAAAREQAVKYGAIVGAMQALEGLADYIEAL
ncbi:MAG: SRPBCC domain-containing protein [Anaerolineales bacterium]|nr:SRPBCC domain-containing protein [Anaerolineales bacterium]